MEGTVVLVMNSNPKEINDFYLVLDLKPSHLFDICNHNLVYVWIHN